MDVKAFESLPVSYEIVSMWFFAIKTSVYNKRKILDTHPNATQDRKMPLALLVWNEV